MPGVFADETASLRHQNVMFAAEAVAAFRTSTFKADVTPAFGTVYGDLDVDNDYDEDTVYTDWNFTQPAPGDNLAKLTRQYNFVSGDVGETYYGAVIYIVIGGQEYLYYSERFTTPFVVPSGGGAFIWQFNLHLVGGCP